MLVSFFFNELKYRIFYCLLFFLCNFLILLLFSKEVLFLLVKPLLLINGNDNFTYFIFTNMTDIFFLYIQISFVISLFLSIPFILLQGYFFLVEGLYNYERSTLIFILIFMLVLFICVLFLLYFYIIPFIWVFFINFELTSNESLFGVYYEPKINDYISFYISINQNIILSMLLFPSILFLLIFLNLNTVYSFFKYRRQLILLIFIIGGIFSPPDIFSQVFIASFLLFLYEFVLLINLIHGFYKQNKKN